MKVCLLLLLLLLLLFKYEEMLSSAKILKICRIALGNHTLPEEKKYS